MTDDTGPLLRASHSWILGRASFNCVSQCAIDSFVSRSQSCGPRRAASQQGCQSVAMSLLSPLASSQVPAPRTDLAETPSFEVRSAKVVARYLVFRQHVSRGRRGTISARASPFQLECRMRCHCSPGTTEQLAIPSIRSACHLSDSRIFHDVRCACLVRHPLLGDNHCL